MTDVSPPPTPNLPPLGPALRRLRKANDLTLAQVALHLYGNEDRRSNISALETGTQVPRLTTLEPLAQLYGTTAEEVIRLARELASPPEKDVTDEPASPPETPENPN